MNIIMITNTYTPHVGGVAQSIVRFVECYRNAGHRVLVVAPNFENMPEDEEDVVRLPAIQHFNGSDFSVVLHIPSFLNKALSDFGPEIIHSHHPFLLGDTAIRISASRNIPLIFTHHTMHEDYTHYVPGDSEALQRFVVELATGYANLCDHVIAPSESVQRILEKRGVVQPITVIPTGVDVAKYSKGDGSSFRKRAAIPDNAFLMGYVGRLAPEKNLEFLSDAIIRVIQRHPRAHFAVVGSGSSSETIEEKFRLAGLQDRLHLVGTLKEQALVDAYHALDLFTFASKSETQGMVLVEAMAAGVPVVALDAPGSREIVNNMFNGFLVRDENVVEMGDAMICVMKMDAGERRRMSELARATAGHFTIADCAEKALEVYAMHLTTHRSSAQAEDSSLQSLLRLIEEEWNLWANRASAAAEAAWGTGAGIRE